MSERNNPPTEMTVADLITELQTWDRTLPIEMEILGRNDKTLAAAYAFRLELNLYPRRLMIAGYGDDEED